MRYEESLIFDILGFKAAAENTIDNKTSWGYIFYGRFQITILL